MSTSKKILIFLKSDSGWEPAVNLKNLKFVCQQLHHHVESSYGQNLQVLEHIKPCVEQISILFLFYLELIMLIVTSRNGGNSLLEERINVTNSLVAANNCVHF